MLKNILFILAAVSLSASVFAQVPRAKIISEPMSEARLTTLGLSTNSVSSGAKIAANGTYFYFSPKNIANSNPITAFTFTLMNKPAGSTAVLETLLPTLTGLKVDLVGNYDVKLSVTTAGGTHDTTMTFVSGNYVGVGGFDGVAGSYPKCMTCHQGTPAFSAIFTRWKDSKHGLALKKEMTTGPASFGVNCLKCHTTGYNSNLAATNGGFDDIAANIGYVYSGPPNPLKWDTLKAAGSGALVNLATVGCEMCHGAGSQHAAAPSPSNIAINYEAGACMRCHDSPPYYRTFNQFAQTRHSQAVWSSSFAQGATSQNNSMGNCIRCHDAKGYINYSYGRTTNTTGWTEANQTDLGCSMCHDPHGTTNPASLRFTPTVGDTLGTGESYTNLVSGEGKLCMNCHKARRNNITYVPSGAITSSWGPHHSTQTDNLLGKNASEFNGPYISSIAHKSLQGACVTCHMAADTTAINKDKVGSHTWRMSNPDNGYDNTTACKTCHGNINSFEEIIATADYDGDGTVEPFQVEFDGLVRLLRIALPPVGIDSVSWSMINTNNNLAERKAFWNYMLISYDGSRGVHNPKYAISVLRQSILAIGGVVPVELTEFNASVVNNNVTLNWATGSETNNKGFSVERKGKDNNWTSIAFVNGKGNANGITNYSYIDKNAAKVNTKSVAYRLKQVDLDGSTMYTKEVEVEITLPNSLNLAQNYPNPFNPSTKITFELPEEGMVTLKVYNIAGIEVATLVGKPMEVGRHEVIFDATQLSSGVYFYRLQFGSETITRKMVIMK
jgi:hypothetical protein